MSLIIKLFCAVLVIGLAGLFVLKKPDGTPWLSVNNFIPNTETISLDAKALFNDILSNKALSNKIFSEGNHNSGDVYRWKDKNGQWQYSDTPPENQAAENISVNGNLNSDLAKNPSKNKAPKSTTNETTLESNTEKTSLLPSTLAPDQVSKLIKDTNNVQKLIDDRHSQLEQQFK